MSNITISLDEATHRTARIVAAERGISVSALVRDLLSRVKPQQSPQPQMSVIELLDWAASTGQYNASKRYSREEVNDRAFMREEHQKSLKAERQSAKPAP
jgi:plasmid stability protein